MIETLLFAVAGLVLLLVLLWLALKPLTRKSKTEASNGRPPKPAAIKMDNTQLARLYTAV